MRARLVSTLPTSPESPSRDSVAPGRLPPESGIVPVRSARPTRLEVNADALAHNLRVLSRLTRVPVLGVVKADGYGHGASFAARTLEQAGVSGLCVALLEEAMELRAAGVSVPVLVMGGYYGSAWSELLEERLTPIVYDAAHVEGLADAARQRGVGRVPVHLKVDTGMTRLGVFPHEIARIARSFRRHPEVRLEGVMTHLAAADTEDEASVHEQLAVFDSVVRDLTALGFGRPFRHAANSAAALRFESARLDGVRPGLALFGVHPCSQSRADLRPVLRLVTHVVAMKALGKGRAVGYGATWRAPRESRIATIPLGYADGLCRSLSNRGQVLVRGRRAPIVGAISMDLATVDVTGIEGAAVGDEVVVIGAQRGSAGAGAITVDEVAAMRGTIPWEVCTGISRRVPRILTETTP